jgi:hypothetical protein
VEFKLYGDTPHFHDAAFYAGREVSDHIHEPGHRPRLLESLALVDDILTRQDLEMKSLADWGAGNGGLLSEIKKAHPELAAWGYDLSPKAVEYARQVYGVDVQLLDIVNDEPKRGEIVVLTEVLEHLVNPHQMVESLLHDPPLDECRWVVASSPAFEDFQRHYEYHLWCWTADSYAQMFERAGWIVRRSFVRAEAGTQFVVAMSPELA